MKRFVAIILSLVTAPLAAQEAVFDNHVHLHDGEASARAYEAKARADGQIITGYGAMWFGGGNQAPAGNTADIRTRNDALLAMAKRHPAMLPIATVHPYDGDAALVELARLAASGVKVMKIHPHTQQFDASDPRVLSLVRRAGELGIIVMMDNANILPGDSEKLFNLALGAPKTKFIFAHIGGLNFRFWNVLKLIRTAEGLFGNNIWFDISATVTIAADSPLAEEFAWTLRNVGIDHILLGSDYPQFSIRQNADALSRLPLTAEEKAKIRSGNAQRLFALNRP